MQLLYASMRALGTVINKGVLLVAVLGLSLSFSFSRPAGPNIKVGLGETIITAPVGTPLSGYARQGVSTGVHDELHARSLVIEAEKGTPVVLMTLAIVDLRAELQDQVRALIREKTGIPEDNIIISCTHTHSGPDYEQAGESYLKFLIERSADSAIQAWQNRVPGRVGIGSTQVLELGRNDRRLEYGGLHPDPEVGIIKVEDAKGKLLGVVFNYGCHPSVLDLHNFQFTEDWPYYAIKAIKEALGQDVWAAYFQSAQGDIKVGYTAELSAVGAEMPIRNFWYAEVKGRQMAEGVVKALPGIRTGTNPGVNVANGYFSYPLRDSYPVTAAKAEAESKKAVKKLEEMQKESDSIGKRVLDRYRVDVFLTGLALDGARWVESHPHPAPILSRQQAAAIGDAVFVTFPGEVFSEIGLKVKQQSPVEKTFILGIAGGVDDYIPTAEEYKEGGYATLLTHYSPKCEEVCIQASLELIKKLGL